MQSSKYPATFANGGYLIRACETVFLSSHDRIVHVLDYSVLHPTIAEICNLFTMFLVVYFIAR